MHLGLLEVAGLHAHHGLTFRRSPSRHQMVQEPELLLDRNKLMELMIFKNVDATNSSSRQKFWNLLTTSSSSWSPREVAMATKKKVAFVTGITVTGQDGSYLAEFLLKKGYEVHGIKRCASSFNQVTLLPALAPRSCSWRLQARRAATGGSSYSTQPYFAVYMAARALQLSYDCTNADRQRPGLFLIVATLMMELRWFSRLDIRV